MLIAILFSSDGSDLFDSSGLNGGGVHGLLGDLLDGDGVDGDGVSVLSGGVVAATSGETKHTGDCECKKYFLHHVEF